LLAHLMEQKKLSAAELARMRDLLKPKAKKK